MTSLGPPQRPNTLDLPAFGLGCAPIGDLYERLTDAHALATVHRALDLGIRLFDVAPRYGAGLAEHRLGRALRDADRTEIVISTKVGWLLDDDGAARPDFSAKGVAASLAASLDRLGVDAVDLVHIHDPDDHLGPALDEALPELLALRAAGVIRAIGVGMNDSGLLSRFVPDTGIDYVLIAGRYTLLEQPALRDLLPLCLDHGVGVIVGGIYNSGLLADPRPGAKYNYASAPEVVLERAVALREHCAAHGVPLKAAAVQLPPAHPAVHSVVIGAASPEEAAENAAMARTPIPPELWQDLRESGLLDPRAPTP
ncbi:aldo/keto reductase [Nonomuraea sp. NPDC050536]|uniref:aldo/keto reductase n=1 Tax=Nonomuraea sp. NPDC050536 TaxID=3364366 RepID=UPI0037CC3E3D